MRFHALLVKRVYTTYYFTRVYTVRDPYHLGVWLFTQESQEAQDPKSQQNVWLVKRHLVFHHPVFMCILTPPSFQPFAVQMRPRMADHQWNLDSANVAEARPALSPSPHSARQPLVLVTSASFTLCSCLPICRLERHSVAAFCTTTLSAPSR